MQWNNTDVNNYATSTIHKYLNETYYNTLPTQDREKLGTKAVQEEFHAELINGATVYKSLYGWSTLTANVWLPSMSELVGYTGTEDSRVGTYYSAMQGLNTSNAYDVDIKGGTQWELLQAYNTASGGEKIWNICQEDSWIRSPDKMFVKAVWVIAGSDMISWNQPVTDSHAVHPAVLYNPERPIKQTALLRLYRRIICLYLMEQRQSWKYAVEQYGRQ